MEERLSPVMFSLAGKTALVTGASSGIGQAIALGLAQAGANLLLVARRDNMQETEELVRATGRQASTVTADLSDLSSLKDVCRQILADHTIDILVNNAGMTTRGPAIDLPSEDWHRVLDTNLHALFIFTQEIARPMLARQQGKIINTASILSFQGGINVVAYATSKHAVAGLTKALANEWAASNVQVNSIAPGYIQTRLTKALHEDPERHQAILDRIPAGRWGRPEDLAGAAVFLASSASDYVTGHILAVDGGWLAR